jgi:hypothetical protein
MVALVSVGLIYFTPKGRRAEGGGDERGERRGEREEEICIA